MNERPQDVYCKCGHKRCDHKLIRKPKLKPTIKDLSKHIPSRGACKVVTYGYAHSIRAKYKCVCPRFRLLKVKKVSIK